MWSPKGRARRKSSINELNHPKKPLFSHKQCGKWNEIEIIEENQPPLEPEGGEEGEEGFQK